jgi:uncharacterized protein YneR
MRISDVYDVYEDLEKLRFFLRYGDAFKKDKSIAVGAYLSMIEDRMATLKEEMDEYDSYIDTLADIYETGC